MSLQDLSPSEIYLLSILYELGQSDIYGILDRVSSEKNWRYTTVLTLVSRIFDKGYLDKKKESKRYIFTPKLSKADSFRIIMDRLFGSTLVNDPTPLLNYLLMTKKIKKSDRTKITALLAKFS